MTPQARLQAAIDTERLHLRAPVEGDKECIISILNDWEVVRHLARVPHPYGPQDAEFFFEQVVPNELVWAITLTDTEKLIGVIGIKPDTHGNPAGLGYYLECAHWGKRIVTEAGHAVLRYGFEVMGYDDIMADYFQDNSASGRVLQKLGFTQTGNGTLPCLAEGKDKPSYETRLTKTDWQQH